MQHFLFLFATNKCFEQDYIKLKGTYCRQVALLKPRNP